MWILPSYVHVEFSGHNPPEIICFHIVSGPRWNRQIVSSVSLMFYSSWPYFQYWSPNSSFTPDVNVTDVGVNYFKHIHGDIFVNFITGLINSAFLDLFSCIVQNPQFSWTAAATYWVSPAVLVQQYLVNPSTCQHRYQWINVLFASLQLCVDNCDESIQHSNHAYCLETRSALDGGLHILVLITWILVWSECIYKCHTNPAQHSRAQGLIVDISTFSCCC